jgi:hypothetical protein
MNTAAYLGKTVLLLAVFCAPRLHAEQGLLTFVFGPSSPEAARSGARAAAAAARHWMQTPGAEVELRRSGSPDAQHIAAGKDAREIEQTFLDAALATRDADPPSFLLTLDSAAQSAGAHPGARVVVVVLNSPSFSIDGERTLENLGQICHSHGVRVLVLDVGDDAKHVPSTALRALASKTGGAWVRQAKDLEPQVAMAMVTPPKENTSPAAPAAPADPAPKPSEETPSTGFNIPFAIPVHVRLMRVSRSASKSEGAAGNGSDFGEPFTLVSALDFTVVDQGSMEDVSWPNDPHELLHGLVMVESPLTAFRFDKDDTASAYQGHARITAIVRDAKGAAIWTGRKDVNLHGPLARLAKRREGSIFFMRAVTLMGQGPFTVEAKVEDLVGQTTGTITTPVHVGRNALDLVATDALVVRPVKGSADAFESDQILEYEGETLSPVLDPVYRADQPVDMQVYLRLYPDIHGTPLDMSMEVLNEGKVVGRMTLPFKGTLSNSALDGPTSGATNKSNIYGAQAKEFPYLVNMKGARLTAGDYQGLISIHQGKDVIKRVVAFKVVGSGSAQAAGAGPQTSAATDEAETIVLPEIESATIDSSGVKLRDVDQRALWEAAAKNAMGYLAQLPNFQCIQETHRFTASAKTPDHLTEADSYLDQLVFEDGKEQYQRLETNGEKVDAAPAEDKGVASRNEFGSLLRGLFDPDVGASYHWAGRSMTLGVLCQVFEFQVSRAKSNFVLHSGSNVAAAAYTGRVFIDENNGMVRRLTIEGRDLPKDFRLQSPALSLDYGMVKIGDKDYLLPLRSVLQLRQAKTFIRNESVFRGYRKWNAESQIKFGKQN